MTKIDMGKMCEGCLSYNKDAKHGGCMGYRIKDVKCPCINCLVKMMCEDICDEYQNRAWGSKNDKGWVM